jgi:hypothetical protein
MEAFHDVSLGLLGEMLARMSCMTRHKDLL